ncbi:hypothetical protein RFI_34248 [Reticulomyxa filosa]|uniref:Kelch motif family protein n=1 Tax=Reticulomyxa filosa TaxID=46433 RepID=X6LPS7_RETFI|nr:hypothetical protein RFI_34248 [Reticulomyxa filosa]|eukprot:ETO03162.1 hypothetical protein RFI_34248 [Reticulomyxa filosa]
MNEKLYNFLLRFFIFCLNDMSVQDSESLVNIETCFDTLAPLPRPLRLAQCVVHKHKILICGGAYAHKCYSCHTLKNKYKLICFYPNDIELFGHCVVKIMNSSNPNEIKLVSFGGKYKHTLIMNYVSVWKEEEGSDNNEEKKTIKITITLCNQWMLIANKQKKQIFIGRSEDDYLGVGAIIDGSENHVLFINYREKNIDVFNLKTLQYVEQCYSYGCVYVNHLLLFFGGEGTNGKASDRDVQIKTKLWERGPTKIEQQWIVEEEEKMEIEEIKQDLERVDQHFDIANLQFFFRTKEIEMIIANWVYSLSIKKRWIDDFGVIIIRYILVLYCTIIPIEIEIQQNKIK